ncbi:unnamed protein product [Arctia plantaginis]|uniref:Uncharacterized protein n=1 Tax=Arctia plantaginis TaxID=874455 RepID=A0A8S1AV92_ARCPL|nr:unnamed protein product [Arctia plantaginis]
MHRARSETDTESSSSSEEDVDSGIVDELSIAQRKDLDCMDLSEFFGYCVAHNLDESNDTSIANIHKAV